MKKRRMLRPIILMLSIAITAWQLPDLLEKVSSATSGQGLSTGALTQQLGLGAGMVSPEEAAGPLVFGVDPESKEAASLRAEALRNAPLGLDPADVNGLSQAERDKQRKRRLRLIGQKLGQAEQSSK